MRIYNIYHDIRKNSIYYRPGNQLHARICVIQKDGIFWWISRTHICVIQKADAIFFSVSGGNLESQNPLYIFLYSADRSADLVWQAVRL